MPESVVDQFKPIHISHNHADGQMAPCSRRIISSSTNRRLYRPVRNHSMCARVLPLPASGR